MKRFIIFSSIALAVLIILSWAVSYYNKKQKKSLSPEEHVTFNTGDLSITVFYNRPSKKGREIFGELVPYDKVWRTGANEATTFDTNKDLNFDSKTLRKGKYSLWTVPGKEVWKIIFNAEYGQWGVNSDGNANRNPDRDVLTIEVPALTQERELEQFTIAFDNLSDDAEMVLMWDKTLVAIPFNY